MAYGFQGLKSLGMGGEQTQEQPPMSLPVKQPAYDPAGYASFAKPSVSDTKGQMSQSPKDAVIAKYGYTPGQMPGINKDVAGVKGTAFNNWDGTTKNEIRSSIAETAKPKAAKPSVKEEVRKAGYNPQESLGDLVATAIDNGGALSDEQIAQYFPEFKGKEKVVGDYFATLNEKPDLTPEETQQYFPEFFDKVQDNVDSEYKYNAFDYVKRGAEWLNKKAENIDIPVVEPIVQGVLGTAEFAAKGLRDITQAGASTLDRGIAAATGTERVYDRSVAEDVFDAAQGTWNTALAVYAPLATTAFNAAMQAVPVEGQQKIGEVFNDVGSFVGKLPGVKQIKETLPPDRQQEFEQEVVGAMVGLIIGSKNKSNIYKNPLKFFSENLNPKALARNIQENVINIPARAVGSAKVSEKVAAKVSSAPQKAYEATRKLAQGANEAYARKVTGLSQKAVDTFKSNPTRRNVEAGQLTEDGLMKEVADTIASEKSRLDETGKAYEAVRNKDTIVNVGTQLPDITEKLGKYNISVAPDGKLNFADSALESDAAGQKAIQFTYDVAKRGEIPADIFLNKRLDISNSIDWRSGVSDTANKITKEIRNSLNAAGHRDVGGLGALDETYGPQRKVWNQIAREFIDRETGTLKDSAKSKIMNMTNANKEALLAKIEQYFPDISLKVDALRTAREVDGLKGIKAGTYNKTALIAGGAKAGYELGQRIVPGGGLIGAPLGAIAGFIATDPAYIIKRLKGLDAKVPEEILKKIKNKDALAKKESQIVVKAIEKAKSQAKGIKDAKDIEIYNQFKKAVKSSENIGKGLPNKEINKLPLKDRSELNLGTKENPIVAKAPKAGLKPKK